MTTNNNNLIGNFSHLLQNLDPSDLSHLQHIPTVPTPPSPTVPSPPAVPPTTTPVEFVKGKKGADNVVWDGHRYNLDRKRAPRSYWRCTLYKQHGCTGRLILDGSNTVVNSPVHNHEEQSVEVTLTVHRAKQRLKRFASNSDYSSKHLNATCCS